MRLQSMDFKTPFDKISKIQQLKQQQEHGIQDHLRVQQQIQQQQQQFQDVLCSLTFGSADVRLRAAREVRRLTKTSAKTRIYLAAAGVIQPLVSMLKAPCEEAQEAALLALLNLAVGNERNKLKIVKAGVVPPLVELLKSGDAVRESAAAAIYTLSAAAPNKAIIGSSGAIPLLVEMLTGGSLQGKVDSVMALYNLSTVPENVQTILRARPVVASLLLLLKSYKKTGNVVEKATSLLETLASFEEGRASIDGVDGGILTLVEVIEDGSFRSREHAVATLVMLCRSDRSRFRDAILGAGVIPGLLELTVQGSDRAQRMAHSLLEMLRDAPAAPNGSVEDAAAAIESIVSDIAMHVDGGGSGAAGGGFGGGGGSARKMLSEMVQMSMEQSMRHLQQRAFSSCAPSGVAPRRFASPCSQSPSPNSSTSSPASSSSTSSSCLDD